MELVFLEELAVITETLGICYFVKVESMLDISVKKKAPNVFLKDPLTLDLLDVNN
jgi:hypothetical protein